jgi:hypothetical protein
LDIYKIYGVKEGTPHTCKPPDVPFYGSTRGSIKIYNLKVYQQQVWDGPQLDTGTKVSRELYALLATDAVDWEEKTLPWKLPDWALELDICIEHSMAICSQAFLQADKTV